LGFGAGRAARFWILRGVEEDVEAFGAPIDEADAGAIADSLLKKYGSAGPS
jgi:hypothetical protein